MLLARCSNDLVPGKGLDLVIAIVVFYALAKLDPGTKSIGWAKLVLPVFIAATPFHSVAEVWPLGVRNFKSITFYLK